MIFAGKLIQKGYAIAYVADAKVVHSHNYTNSQQFHRNFDMPFHRQIIRRFLAWQNQKVKASAW